MLCADCQASWQKTWITTKTSETAAWPRFFLACKIVKSGKKWKRAKESHQKLGIKSWMILRILTVAWNLSETQADKSDIWGDSVFLWKCKLFSGGKHEVWHQTGGLESWEKPSSVWKNIFLVSKDFLCKTLFNSYITDTKIHSKLEYIMLNNNNKKIYIWLAI